WRCPSPGSIPEAASARIPRPARGPGSAGCRRSLTGFRRRLPEVLVVAFEHSPQTHRLAVVIALVRPGLTRLEDLVGDVRDMLRDLDLEHRVGHGGHV